MNVFRFFILLILILFYGINVFCLTNAKKSDSVIEECNCKFGLSYSPRYSNVIFEDYNYYRVKNFQDEYVQGFIFHNFNFYYYHEFGKHNLSIVFGLSYLQYGVIEDHIVYQIKPYDTISIKERLNVFALPVGLIKKIYFNGFHLEGEIGLINNLSGSISQTPIESKYQNYFYGYGIPNAKKYFVSIYFKLGFLLNIGDSQIMLEPIFNFTPYNVSAFGNPRVVKLYQVGLDIGLRF